MLQINENRTVHQKVFWHLKILVGAIIISGFFSLVLQHKLIHGQALNMLIMTFIQLEIFIWIGTKVFSGLKEDTRDFKKKILIRLVLFFISVLVIASFFFITVFYFNYLKSGWGFESFAEAISKLEIKSFFITTMIGFSLGALFFFYTQWNESLKREKKLAHEKLIFQNETLKSQVNPHFLFNSLNVLSSLVGTNAELSELFIRKLSGVYRYILDNMEKELVPLADEIGFVNDYFYLQKIRDDDKITLKIELNQDDKSLIIPVSLQLLVENALKHNLATRKQPLEITIHNEGIDKVVVRNNLQKKTQLNDSSKIGLKNLRVRCLLILNRELEVQETPDEFVVKLPVKPI